jgi:hypothetical protein
MQQHSALRFLHKRMTNENQKHVKHKSTNYANSSSNRFSLFSILPSNFSASEKIGKLQFWMRTWLMNLWRIFFAIYRHRMTHVRMFYLFYRKIFERWKNSRKISVLAISLIGDGELCSLKLANRNISHGRSLFAKQIATFNYKLANRSPFRLQLFFHINA